MKIVKKVFKWSFIVFVGLFVIGMLSIGFSDGWDSDIREPKAVASIATEEEKEEVVYQEITATDIIDRYKNNELEADKSLKNKRGIIVGKVSSVERVFGQIYITLEGNNEWDIIQVQCYFNNDKADTLTNISKGDIVEIEGTIEGKGWNVDVRDCILR